jgi:hypothetical protein
MPAISPPWWLAVFHRLCELYQSPTEVRVATITKPDWCASPRPDNFEELAGRIAGAVGQGVKKLNGSVGSTRKALLLGVPLQPEELCVSHFEVIRPDFHLSERKRASSCNASRPFRDISSSKLCKVFADTAMFAASPDAVSARAVSNSTPRQLRAYFEVAAGRSVVVSGGE